MTLQRTAPIRRKSAKPRKPKPAPGTPTCAYPVYDCRTVPRVIVSDTERYCKRHATWIADKLLGDFVKERDGRCVLADFNPAIECFTRPNLFWCHLIPKGRYPSVRWEPTNAVAGCFAHHKDFDENWLGKERWCEQRLGAEWDRLMALRLQRGPKVADVIRFWRAALTPTEGDAK